MRKGDKGKKVFGVFVILAIFVSVFSGVVAATTYDPQAAVIYADTWWNGRNPNYHDYSNEGGDGANFVSQCLIAGGLDLSGHPGADSWGCIPSCTNLHDYLVNYLGATYETRAKSQMEPIWFVPGDPAIFPAPKHAVFAVTGDATHYATCNAHSTDRYHRTIQWFFDNSNWNSCTYYHIPTDIPTPPAPPTITSPGSSSGPGPTIDTLTPTLQWASVSNSNADKYLYDMGIATGQSVGYYEPYQTQLDSELHNIEAPNQQPTAIIDSITTDPAEQETDTVSFTGHGTDPDGTVEAYNWSSSIDGLLSTSATFTKPASELSVGTHTIYFKVQDNDGAWSTKDTEDLTINPANVAPTAIIDSITPDPAVQGSDTVSFTGHGTDPDGTVDAYDWSSSIDGPLSTSAAFTKPASELSVGTHTIYFKVQDNDGAWSTEDTEDLTIYPGPELSYSPESHEFGDMREGETDNTTFEIWNSGTDTLTYSLSETCDWLEVNPTSGTSTGEHNSITVDMDTTGLSEVSHTCDIKINSNDESGTFTIMVNVVPCPCGNMGVNSTSWSTTLNCGKSDDEIVTVSATGGTINGVTVSKVSGPTWLSVSPTDLGDIASGSSETFTVTATPPAGTSSGDYPYTIRVSNTCGSPSSRDVAGMINVNENADGQTDYWAVIVGVADYTGTSYDLAYTDDDAIDMYNTLLLSDDYWQENHIRLLLDSEADRAGILTAFDWLDSNEDPDDVVLFFFSGHGTYGPDDDGDELDGWDEFFCPYDFNNIRDDELDAELDRLGSTSIAVIMDTCFAGGMTKDSSVKTLPKQKVELTDGFAKDIQSTGKDMGDAGRVVLMACDDNEYSYEIYALENGLFSYYVIEGLERSADAEGNGDNICSAEETSVYAEPRVVAYGSPTTTQHPQLYDEYTGELPITRPPCPESSWTYMVYLDGDNNLEGAGIDDFIEMSSVGSTSDVNIVVQFDRIPGYVSSYGGWTTCKRFHVTSGMTPTAANALIDLGECNMGNPNTLRDFVEWTMTEFPADNYALILWNHGDGWKSINTWVPWAADIKDAKDAGLTRGICVDNTNNDYLSLQETEVALTGKYVQLLGYDACLMHMIEVVYQVMANAGISVGSEEVEPWDGWPYDTILTDLTVTPTMNEDALGTVIVDRYMASYPTYNDLTQSAMDNSALPNLVAAVDTLAQALMTEINAGHVADVQQARNAAEEIYYNYYIDLYHFAEMIQTSVPGAAAQAQAVMNEVSGSMYEAHGSSVPNDHGLSIYYPRNKGDYLASYDNTAFASDTQWDEFLKKYYAPTICGNMNVNPTSWSPTINCGESDNEIVTVSASDGIVNGVTVSKVSGPTWLSVSPTDLGDIASGSSKTFTMTAAPPSETSGDFGYTVRVSNTCGTPSTRDVSGTINVSCPCGNMGMNSTSWSPRVNCSESDNEIVTVSATGGSVKGVTVGKISGPTWLSVSPTDLGDIASGSSKTFTMTASPPSETSGDFGYTIRVSNTCGTPSTRDVSGTINVSCPCGNMGMNSTSWSPTLNCSESDNEIVTVSATGGTVKGVTVSKVSGPTWLSVSPTNLGGIASGSSKTFTMTTSPPSEASGDYPYTITVSNTCGSPSSIDVTGTIHVDCPKSSWTYMVYLDGDNNLEGAAIDDFMEMSSVGSTSDVNIVVQFDRIPGYVSSYGDWTDCKRFHVTSGMTPTAANAISDLGECNMGDPNTLDAFVTWAMTEFPADNYALILWNHGDGWKSINNWIPWVDDIKDAKDAGLSRGICVDNTDKDYLSLQETEDALTGKYVQLLGYDACLMHMVEVVYQVMANAGVSVGSEEVEPWDGWPYDTILADLTGTPTMSEDALGTVIVDRYMDSYGYTGSETQSAVDNSDFSSLVAAVDNLAQALMTEINAGHVAEVQQARNAAEEIYYNYYIDLYHFAEKIKTDVPGAIAQAQAVMNSVNTTVYTEAHGTSVPNDHGLSIYFPRVEGDYLASYDNTAFASDTQWNEFLKKYYNPPTQGADIAVFSAPLWFVDKNGDHLADDVFGYGFAGATPLVGDFNQDGTDDIAVFSAPLWFVDTNGDHLADDVFGYGFAGATPLVGDINQDGTDDIAVFSAPLWFVDTNGDHLADDVFGYGFAGATPLVGDINQDGADDIAVFRAPLWFVDTNGDHVADDVFGYGFAGATPLVGDINQDGTDDIAVFSAPLWFVDTNDDHLADDVFGYGFAGATPIVGNFG